MFPTIRAEMARGSWRQKDLAKAAGISPAAFSQKLNGIREFTRGEMWAIRGVLAPHMSIEDLFVTDEEASVEA